MERNIRQHAGARSSTEWGAHDHERTYPRVVITTASPLPTGKGFPENPTLPAARPVSPLSPLHRPGPHAPEGHHDVRPDRDPESGRDPLSASEGRCMIQPDNRQGSNAQ